MSSSLNGIETKPKFTYVGEPIHTRACVFPTTHMAMTLYRQLCEKCAPTAQIKLLDLVIANIHQYPKVSILILQDESFLRDVIKIIKLLPCQFLICSEANAYDVEIPPPFVVNLDTAELHDIAQIPTFLDFASASILTYCISHEIPCKVAAVFLEPQGPTIDSIGELARLMNNVIDFDFNAVIEETLRLL